MEFLLIVAAWILFVMGVINLVGETYRYVTRAGKVTLAEGDWFVLVRLTFSSVCLAGWYWILFIHL